MDMILNIQTEEIQTDGRDTFHFHRYEPTPYEVIETLFDAFPLKETDVLVDYGCGLGRLNFYATTRFHCHTIGIEMDTHYYERALQNKNTYNGNKDAITFLNCPAEEYQVSVLDNFFYFFNPFSTVIFKKVINQILASLSITPRIVYIVLYYPEDDTIFYLEHHTIFERVDEIAASDNVRNDRRERFCIYRYQI